MAVKTLAFNIFSAFFSIAVVLSNWTSCALLALLAPLCSKSELASNLSKRWTQATYSDKREMQEYVKILTNMLLGMIFSEWLIDYHCYLVEAIVTITYQLLLLSSNWAIDLPDYSAFLKESEAIKMITILFYLVLGLLGLSTQMAFTIDLLKIFSYPFRALGRGC